MTLNSLMIIEQDISNNTLTYFSFLVRGATPHFTWLLVISLKLALYHILMTNAKNAYDTDDWYYFWFHHLFAHPVWLKLYQDTFH